MVIGVAGTKPYGERISALLIDLPASPTCLSVRLLHGDNRHIILLYFGISLTVSHGHLANRTIDRVPLPPLSHYFNVAGVSV